MVVKRILCSARLRRVPRQFSWLDHRLVRDEHFCGMSHSSLALYLFLVTVCDADGLSYYSDRSIERHLSLRPSQLVQTRHELCAAGFIAYSKPIYQVLSVEKPAVQKEVFVADDPHQRRGSSDIARLGDVLREAMRGAQ